MRRHFEEIASTTLPRGNDNDSDEDSNDKSETSLETDSVERTVGIGKTEPKKAIVDEDGFAIKCICGLLDDDGNIVLCERCETWQQFQCYYSEMLGNSKWVIVPNVHDVTHYCVDCQPRPVDA